LEELELPLSKVLKAIQTSHNPRAELGDAVFMVSNLIEKGQLVGELDWATKTLKLPGSKEKAFPNSKID
jgi:hypothetical protein